jgi:hypothetical protein
MTTFLYTKDDFISLGKGLAITLIGSALTYLTEYISGTNFGAYTPVIVAVWSVIVNIVRKGIDSWIEKKTGVRI